MIYQTVIPPPAARIALVSDTHTNFGTEGDQPLYRERLAKVIAAVNGAGVDVVVVAGDLSENGTPEEFALYLKSEIDKWT
ncbi:MAG: metallophosphoesterase, partial [Armatimonadota bacterium]